METSQRKKERKKEREREKVRERERGKIYVKKKERTNKLKGKEENRKSRNK